MTKEEVREWWRREAKGAWEKVKTAKGKVTVHKWVERAKECERNARER